MIDVPARNYLVDVDDGFYCASYLRAWMLEGAFRMILQDRYGRTGSSTPRPSDWLKGMWADGQHFPAERLLLKHGGGRLEHRPAAGTTSSARWAARPSPARRGAPRPALSARRAR